MLTQQAREVVVGIVEDARDNEQEMVEYAEIEAAAEELDVSVQTIIGIVKGLGMRVGSRPKAKEVRGFTSNSHDRWFGKGSSATHGGSGWEQIAGFAGRKG